MYFFKSVFIKKKMKVIPLEGQKIKISKKELDVDTSLNVSCSEAVRHSYPVGTIFYSHSLKPSSTGKYYIASDIFSLDSSTTAKATYEAYAKTLSSLKGETKDDTSKVEIPKVPTFKTDIEDDTTLSAPIPSVDKFYVDRDNWTLLVRNIKKNINTMIIGPTGSGKTSIVKQLCDKMGKKLYIFDMGSMVDPISSLLGVHRLENGESVFDYAKFTQVIQEPCVILLDELSRAAFSTMNILFPCLDDRRKLSIEIASGKGVREIDVHPEVTFIATANIGSEYTGTNSMDRALVNRFYTLELGNIPAAEESSVLQFRCDINEKVSSTIVKIANNIRNIAAKQEISFSISIRETLLVADLVHDGWDLRKAMEMIYLPLFEGTNDEGERATVAKLITSY